MLYFIGNLVKKRFQEVEHDVRLPLVHRAADGRQLVAHFQQPRLVAERAERGEDVVLGLEVVPFLIAARLDVVGRRHAGTDEDEHAEASAGRSHRGMETRRR